MSDKKTDETLNHWTDYFIDGIPWLFTMIGIIWLLIGVTPFFLSQMNIAASGQIGDMFGMANSLFSGFAFTVAMLALVMQVRETRESGERQLKQDGIQLQQMQIAEETVRLQKEMRDRDTRKVIVSCLLKLNKDITRFANHSHFFGVRVLIRHSTTGAPTRSSGITPDSPQSAKDRQRFEESMLELNDDILSVKLLLGPDGDQLVKHIGDVMGFSGKKVTFNPKAHAEFRDCVNSTKQEIERVWKLQLNA